MMSDDVPVISWLTASNELFADEISRPRTMAVIVATSPIAIITIPFESSLRWFWGKRLRMNIPNNAPPNTNANTIELITRELMATPSLASWRGGREQPGRQDHGSK